MNLADLLVLFLIAAAAITAIIFYVKGRKSGKTCSCGCQNCSSSAFCKNKSKSE